MSLWCLLQDSEYWGGVLNIYIHGNKFKPDLFTMVKIKKIRQSHSERFSQFRAMLEKWSNSSDHEATNGSLIQTLLKTHMKKQANKIFGEDLVKCGKQSL